MSHVTDVGYLIARGLHTAAARAILDARMAHKTLKDAAEQSLGTTYQTVLKWEKKLRDAGVSLISAEFPNAVRLPNNRALPKETTYEEALAAIEHFHEDPEKAGKEPPVDPAVVQAALAKFIAKPPPGKSLRDIGKKAGVDKFYLSRLAHGKIGDPNQHRLRKILRAVEATAA